MQKVEHEFRGKITLKNLIMMGEKKTFKFGKYSMLAAGLIHVILMQNIGLCGC